MVVLDKFRNWWFNKVADVQVKYFVDCEESRLEGDLTDAKRDLETLKALCKPDVPGQESFVEGNSIIMPFGVSFSEKYSLCDNCKKHNTCHLDEQIRQAQQEVKQAKKNCIGFRKEYIKNWCKGRLYG